MIHLNKKQHFITVNQNNNTTFKENISSFVVITTNDYLCAKISNTYMRCVRVS